MLTIRGLSTGYGEAQVLWDVDLHVGEGEVVALIGSNGAGKTTLLKTVAGLIRPLAGKISYLGETISSPTPQQLVRAGISYVPEGRRLFAGMSVRENILMGAYTRSDKRKVMEDMEWVFHLFPILRERERQLAGDLSGGEQQMCAIARGLMSRPKLLLLDEVSLGLAPIIVDSLLEIVREVNSQGTAVLVVEQDVLTALEHAERGYVLETGRIKLEGSSQELLSNPLMKKAYLGL